MVNPTGPHGTPTPDRVLAWWLTVHEIDLTPGQKEEFRTRPEVAELCTMEQWIVKEAIRRHQKLVDIAAAARILSRDNPSIDSRRSWSSGERDSQVRKQGRKRPTPRSRPKAGSARSASGSSSSSQRSPKGSNRQVKQSGRSSTGRRTTSRKAGTITGIAHRASGYSSSPRTMPAQYDDRERCSNCGALISAAAASSHDC